MNIAKTILEQMKAMDMNLLMCMGFQKPVALERGLRFKVNGFSHKGLVEITLNGADLYDVKLIKLSRKQNQTAKALGVIKFDLHSEVVELIEDVFVEDLMPILESKVEKRRSA